MGLSAAAPTNSSAAQIDFHFVDAASIPAGSRRIRAAQESYCEGYRRGFALGHADGFVLRPEGLRLEASK